MTRDNAFRYERGDQNNIREIMALLEICGLIPDYPRDFHKDSHPDWINDRIGLDATIAVSDEDWVSLRLKEKKGRIPLWQLRNEISGSGLTAWCEYTEGKNKGETFCYEFKMNNTFLEPGRLPYINFYELSEDKRKEMDSATVVGVFRTPILEESTDPAEKPTNYLQLALDGLKEKLEELQSYQQCDEYHLHIASRWSFDKRCLEPFLDALRAKTLEVVGESGRRFDRVFLSANQAICDFDLRTGEFRYVCRRNITDEEFYSVNIPSKSGYAFLEAVKEVPDLSISDP